MTSECEFNDGIESRNSEHIRSYLFTKVNTVLSQMTALYVFSSKDVNVWHIYWKTDKQFQCLYHWIHSSRLMVNSEDMSQSKGVITCCQQLVYITEWFTEMSELQTQDFMKYLIQKYRKSGQQLDIQFINGFSQLGIHFRPLSTPSSPSGRVLSSDGNRCCRL